MNNESLSRYLAKNQVNNEQKRLSWAEFVNLIQIWWIVENLIIEWDVEINFSSWIDVIVKNVVFLNKVIFINCNTWWNIFFENSYISSLELIANQFKQFVNFKNCIFDVFFINSSAFYKWLNLIWCEFYTKFHSTNSNFYNSAFDNINFTNTTLIIENSDISLIEFNNVIFPKLISPWDIDNPDEEIEKIKDLYDKIKWALIKKWNQKEAIKLDYNLNELIYSKLNIINNFFQKIYLFTFKQLNTFWTDPFVNIFWYLAFWLLFFVYYEQDVSLFKNVWIYDFWFTFWTYYLNFLNPVHYFEATGPSIYDISFRFISVFMIYQTFVSFNNYFKIKN